MDTESKSIRSSDLERTSWPQVDQLATIRLEKDDNLNTEIGPYPHFLEVDFTRHQYPKHNCSTTGLSCKNLVNMALNGQSCVMKAANRST